MPEFSIDGKLFNNPVEFALQKIGGKWKMPILWRLKDRVWRYGELKKSLKRVTDKVLAEQLHELEHDGFITREVFPEVPPRVEYNLTEKGKATLSVIIILREFGLRLMNEELIRDKDKGRDVSR